MPLVLTEFAEWTIETLKQMYENLVRLQKTVKFETDKTETKLRKEK